MATEKEKQETSEKVEDVKKEETTAEPTEKVEGEKKEETTAESTEKEKEKVEGEKKEEGAPTKTIEIRTSVMIAAKFADKIRRMAFAVFKNEVARNAILKAVSDLNRRIYQKMVEAGIDKLDVVRISVEARVEGCELVFGEPQIELFVPYSKVAELEKELNSCRAQASRVAELENELNSCRTYMKEMRSMLEKALKYTE